MYNALDSGYAPPAKLMLLEPENIHADPATYQFRSGGDASGVTNKGRFHAQRWDPIIHGDPLLIHEHANGEYFVADGHHRLDLAKRTNAMGTGPGQVAALVLRETDGYTAEDVKIIAAYKNLQHDLSRGSNSTGELVDGARVFKEARSGSMAHPEWLPSLQMNKGNLKLSYRLSNLSDWSLGAVSQGAVPAPTAAIIADHVSAEKQDIVIASLGDTLAKHYDLSLRADGMQVVHARSFAVTLPEPPPQQQEVPPEVLGHLARLRQQRASQNVMTR
jgi:hypothetical protein